MAEHIFYLHFLYEFAFLYLSWYSSTAYKPYELIFNLFCRPYCAELLRQKRALKIPSENSDNL